MKKIYFIVRLMFLLGFMSCTHRTIEMEIERIKNVGNDNPELALEMLDSLENGKTKSNEYIRNSMALLHVRLNDKLEILPTSDLMIQKLLHYFKNHGTAVDKQEVAYYAGSIYRDLQDTPRALQYFFQSLDVADENPEECDSTMLRNTYSNINYLYYKVQDYENSAEVAQKELELTVSLGQNRAVAYSHVACANLAIDSVSKAMEALDSLFNIISTDEGRETYHDHIIYLLCYYSQLGIMPKADSCFMYINEDSIVERDPFYRLSFSRYYESKGDIDYAISQSEMMLDENPDIMNMYESAKTLFRLYNDKGNVEKANYYARLYMSLSDSIDFGGRQELAAKVNNLYKYNRDLKREMKIDAESRIYKMVLILVCFAAVLLLAVGYIIHIGKNNRQLKRIMKLNAELESVTETEGNLKREIDSREQELLQSQALLFDSTDELNKTKRKLEKVVLQMNEYSKELILKEQQLSDRIEQNKIFMNLLHQSEMEENAQDVISDIRKSAIGRKNMTILDWKRLYHAVDELYPHFKSELLNELGHFTEQQMQVCYLIRIGLSNPQIQNITNLSRATVWRWVKKYEWILSL